MKYKLLLYAAALCILLTGCMSYKETTEPGHDYYYLPQKKGMVSDYTSTLSKDQIDELTGASEKLKKEALSEIVVLLVNTIKDESIESYAYRVAGSWNIGGKGKENGILILLSMNDRKVRIEVGSGLVPIISDEFAKRVLDENMIPYFEKNDFYFGILSAHERLSEVIKNNKEMIKKE